MAKSQLEFEDSNVLLIQCRAQLLSLFELSSLAQTNNYSESVVLGWPVACNEGDPASCCYTKYPPDPEGSPHLLKANFTEWQHKRKWQSNASFLV